jgi:hypothetical protein
MLHLETAPHDFEMQGSKPYCHSIHNDLFAISMEILKEPLARLTESPKLPFLAVET